MVIRFIGVVWPGSQKVLPTDGGGASSLMGSISTRESPLKPANEPALASENFGATASALRGAYLTWNPASVIQNTI
jgi:hypothetical protein